MISQSNQAGMPPTKEIGTYCPSTSGMHSARDLQRGTHVMELINYNNTAKREIYNPTNAYNYQQVLKSHFPTK